MAIFDNPTNGKKDLYLKKTTTKRKSNSWQISFAPVLRYNAVFCLLSLITVFIGGVILAASQMKSAAGAAMSASCAQVSQRVEGAVDLLEALSVLPEYYDPSIPPIDKVKKLNQMSPYLGYMMICFVDSNITVYSDGSEPASLASRDYMQRLFAAGETQITDSFAAGADGVTLNYTVAVPLKDPQGGITGCLFCAIYFDEVVQILKQSADVNGAEVTLIGSQGQVMSSTDGLDYGDPIMEELRNDKLFGTTPDKVQELLLNKLSGNFWSLHNGSLYYTCYQSIEGTDWDILCSVNFWKVFQVILPSLFVVFVLTFLLCISLLFILRRYTAGQMQVVDMLVQSVAELEKKIYQEDRPDDLDFKEILRMTSNGLSDGLTGVVTRSVFLNQASAHLKKLLPQSLCALCFVDMDNLKYINDSFGHDYGDIALKSVGYILREYEKKYDGVVGRYGGDEFVLLITALDDEAELRDVLEELVLRMHSAVGSEGLKVPIQCSIGVSIYSANKTLEEMIHEADEELYFVKQNGKGYYRIRRN